MPNHSEPPAASNTSFDLLQFPCAFPLKIVGLQQEHFVQTVKTLLVTQLNLLDAPNLEGRPSRTGRYISLSYTAYVDSKSQLDALYRVLSQHPDVLWVL